MRIDETVTLDEGLLEERFVRAPGPGGQHVNKSATAVQLRFALRACDTLSDDVKDRLRRLAGSRLNRRGDLVLTATRHRSQARNRDEARARLAKLVLRALQEPKLRKPARGPSAAQRRRRVEDKRRRGDLKRQRRRPPDG